MFFALIAFVFIYDVCHSTIPPEKPAEPEKACAVCGAGLVPLTVDASLFENAPQNRRYPKEIYYRLLSPHIPLQNLSRICILTRIFR